MNELMITLVENNWLLRVACGAAGVGGLIQIVLSVIYNRSLNASERMRNTKIAWLRQMKTRYEGGYEWNNRIRNVELFVDKNIGRRKWMGIYLKTWEELSRLMLALVLLLSVLGAIYAGTYMEEKAMPLVYLATGTVLAVLLWGVSVLANIKEKQHLLRTNLCDYFENTLQGEAKNRRKENLQERETAFREQMLREELACAVEERKDCNNTVTESDEETVKEHLDAAKQIKSVVTEGRKQRRAAAKKAKVAERSNKKALRKERKKDKQLGKLAKTEGRRLKKQEKTLVKEEAKRQRKQAKEQKRVDKLTKRMEKMQLRLGTAAASELGGMSHAAGGKKEESARIKREQLKRKVDITPAQEDQIIADVLREFLA